MRMLLSCLALIAATGCVAASPTQLPLPKDLPQQCEQHCSSMGMRLSAIVIIISKSGCVCEPIKESGSQASGTAAAAGAAAIQVETEASEPKQQQ
jgi:hypothetical protein